MRGVLSTQLSGMARRPVRLLLTGLAVLIASFVVYATVLGHQVTTRTVLGGLAGTPAAVDLAVRDGAATEALRGQIAATPGVAEAAARISSTLELDKSGGQYLGVTADPGAGPLATVRLVSGAYPAKPGEIAVTARTVERLALPVGTRTALLSWVDEKKKAVPVTVVGVVAGKSDDGESAYAPAALVGPLLHTDFFDQVDVRLAAGADATAVRQQLETLIAAQPGPAEARPTVRTGAAVRQAEAEQAISDVNALFALVAMFIAIAVIAAALVATSTFRIVFAQRMRQLALLRAVGAGRRRLSGALVVEGAVTGFATGLVGVTAAAVLGQAAGGILGRFGIEVANPGVPLLPAAGVVLGAVVVTVAAVVAPAVNAAKVSPLEALRAAGTTASQKTIGPLRAAFGILLALGGAGLAALVVTMLPNEDTKDYDPTTPLMLIVGSGALAFFALMALGPVLVRPVLYLVGLPLRRTGPVGRLAVGGIGGAPRRAAAVSVVVALGVTLIAGTLVGASSLRTLAESEIALQAPADLELVAAEGGTLPAAVVDRATSRGELTNVTPYRRVPVKLPGTDLAYDAVDLRAAALPALRDVHFSSGSVAGLGPGRVLVSGWVAGDLDVAAGDPITVTLGGRSVRLTVGAALDSGTPLNSSLVLDPADLTALGVPATATGLLADAARPGERGRTDARTALKDAATGTDAAVTVLADQRDEVNRLFDALLGVAIGLIGLTVLIAVVGVGTTTALSVVERVRESGLLRAVGLSRAGLRTMLTAESGLYGVIGATLGLLLGVPYALLTVRALGVDAPLQVPYVQLVLVLVALTVLTALAGVLPARRAARVSPVAALATDG